MNYLQHLPVSVLDLLPIVISIFTLIITALHFLYQQVKWRDARNQHAVSQRQIRINQNLAVVAGLTSQIVDNPEILRFHGISQEQLEKCGLNAEEMAYLVANFMAGQIYYELSEDLDELLAEGSYRRRMCESESTRKAWPLIRDLLDPTDYRKYIDNLMAILNKSSTDANN